MAEELVISGNTELTDNGTPLGTIRVNGKLYTKNPMGSLAKVAEREIQRSKSVDITGDDEADDELLATYDGYDDAEKRKIALVRYVKDGLSALAVAKELDVPESTVLMWAYHGKWNKAASRELMVRAEEEGRALASLRLRHRESLLTKQIEDSSRIQTKLMEKVESGDVSMKSAAESLAALAKVQNSAMGVADSGAITTGAGEERREAAGTTNNTVIYMGGSLPAARKAKEEEVIDVV